MKKTIAFAVAVAGVLTFGAYAGAEEPSAPVIEEYSSSVIMDSRYLPEVDVEHQPGSLAISESRFVFEHKFKVAGELPVTFSLLTKSADINSDVPTFLPSNLVGRELGLGAKFPVPFVDHPNYFMGFDIFPSMYTDGWDKTSSSAFRMPFRTYLIYKRDENFIVFGGLKIQPGFDSTVVPILGMIYKPNEQVAVNFSSDNPTITYQATEKTKLLLEGNIVNDEYEVDHLGQKGRVLFYRELSAGAGVEHSFTNSIKGLVTVGTVFSRLLKYEDDTGKVEPDAGLYVKGRVTVGF